MIAKIVTLMITRHPDGEIGVNVVKPGLKRIRIGSVAEQSSRNNCAAGCIMPAVNTVGIRYATGGRSIPGKIGTILSERSA